MNPSCVRLLRIGDVVQGDLEPALNEEREHGLAEVSGHLHALPGRHPDRLEPRE